MENLFKLNSNENIVAEEIAAKYEKIMLQPYYHINESKGKGFRAFLIQVYNFWIKLDKIEIDFMTNLARWVHSASLLLDDIQDSSDLRRGNPAAHIIYGVGRTVAATDLSGYNFYYSEMNIKTYDTETSAYTFAFNCVTNCLKGQVMETYWRDNFICPSEEDYFDMCIKKTGQAFVGLSDYMEFTSEIKINLRNVSLLLGIYFQLVDDYKGLKSELFAETKGLCDDIREGKFIFPIIHAIKSRPNDTRILDILKLHTNDISLKMKCLQLLEEFGSMEYTRNKIIYYKNLIIQEIKQFEFNSNFEQLFELQNYNH